MNKVKRDMELMQSSGISIDTDGINAMGQIGLGPFLLILT